MKRTYWIGFGPSFLLACGIVAATWVAAHAGGRGVCGLGGMTVLTLATLAADMLDRRLRDRSLRPSWAALLLVGGFAGASAIFIGGDAGPLRNMIPTFGILAWATLLSRPEVESAYCQLVAKSGKRS
jgi:uncharacterized membrane protein YhaH (DUF805 family)